jgi:TPR repeat protein
LERLAVAESQAAKPFLGSSDAHRLYSDLATSVQSVLLSHRTASGSVIEALAELEIDHRLFDHDIGGEWAVSHLYEAAAEGYVEAQLELAYRADSLMLPPPEYSGSLAEHESLTVRRIQEWCSDERFNEFHKGEAKHWWVAAAQNGSSQAQFVVGSKLLVSGHPEEYAVGINWLREAAYNQVPNADAQYALAYQMELGPDDPASLREMFYLYLAAAETGVDEAALALGHYHEHGIGTERNEKEAIHWYLKAAESCSEGYLLAGLLSEDQRHLEDASNAGYVDAMVLLAKSRLNDSFNPDSFESFRTGVDLFQRAAERGNLEAALALAEIFEDKWNGGGLSQHLYESGGSVYDCLEDALSYYEQAHGLGCKWVEKDILRLTKLLEQEVENDGPHL